MSDQDILAAALALPVSERARLAHELIVSLDADADADAHAEIIALNEALRRSDEIDRGVVRPVPLNDAVERLRAGVRR